MAPGAHESKKVLAARSETSTCRSGMNHLPPMRPPCCAQGDVFAMPGSVRLHSARTGIPICVNASDYSRAQRSCPRLRIQTKHFEVSWKTVHLPDAPVSMSGINNRIPRLVQRGVSLSGRRGQDGRYTGAGTGLPTQSSGRDALRSSGSFVWRLATSLLIALLERTCRRSLRLGPTRRGTT